MSFASIFASRMMCFTERKGVLFSVIPNMGVRADFAYAWSFPRRAATQTFTACASVRYKECGGHQVCARLHPFKRSRVGYRSRFYKWVAFLAHLQKCDRHPHFKV